MDTKTTAFLIWKQPEYEGGYDYRIAGTREAAARIVREYRKERNWFTPYEGGRVPTHFIEVCEMEVEH